MGVTAFRDRFRSGACRPRLGGLWRPVGTRCAVGAALAWLRDTDKMYEPVRGLLADGFEILTREIAEDKDMIFGHGELTIYALAGAGSANPAADGTYGNP